MDCPVCSSSISGPSGMSTSAAVGSPAPGLAVLSVASSVEDRSAWRASAACDVICALSAEAAPVVSGICSDVYCVSIAVVRRHDSLFIYGLGRSTRLLVETLVDSLRSCSPAL